MPDFDWTQRSVIVATWRNKVGSEGNLSLPNGIHSSRNGQRNMLGFRWEFIKFHDDLIFNYLTGNRKLVVTSSHVHSNTMSAALLGRSTFEPNWTQHERLGTGSVFLFVGLSSQRAIAFGVLGKWPLVWTDSKMQRWVAKPPLRL